MLPILQIGPLAVRIPGLIWLLGVYGGLTWSERWARQRGVNPSYLENLVLGSAAVGVVAARVGFFLSHPATWTGWRALLNLDTALLDPVFGMTASVIFALAYAQRRALPWGRTLDALTPLLVSSALAAALALLASGAFYGVPTHRPWGIPLWGERRHPTQIYLLLGALLLVPDVWALTQARGRKATPRTWLLPVGAPDGSVFLTALAWLALVVLFVAAWRADGARWPGGVRPEQALAWAVLLGAVWALRRNHRGEAKG